MTDDLKSVLRGTDRQFLEQLQQKYEAQGKAEMVSAIVGELQRQAGEKPVQTLALQDSGKLYQHEYRADDNTGRTFTAYSGDPAVWMQPYMTAAGHTVRTCRENFTGENSPQALAQRAADDQALALGRAALARMNQPERTMASQDSGENSAPAAQGPEVDRALERHVKFWGFSK